MRHRAAESFVINRLPGCAFDQIRAAQAHKRSAFDHQDHVRKRGQISSARDAHSHHGGNLRNFQITAHNRVVIKNPRRAVLTGKNAALIRQIHARRINQINDRHTAAHRNFLRPQNFLDRFGIPRARFDRRIIGNDNRFAPVNFAD